MKKVLLIFFAVFCGVIPVLASDEPVQMTAPKTNTVKTVTDSDLQKGPATVKQAEDATKPKPKTTTTKAVRKKHFIIRPKKIVVDYYKVSKLIEYNYFDEADNILQGAISRNSKDIKAQSLWVVSLAKQCKLDPAQSELNDLLKKYPDNSNLHYAQGVIYYQRTNSSNMLYRNNAQKLTTDAMKEFQKAIALDKTNARALNAAGVISLKLNNPKDAQSYFNKALDADKTYSMAIDNLGTMAFASGKLKDAEKFFKQSLTYNTQNTTAMYHLAQIALKNKDAANALIYLNNALAINPNSPAIYNLMGRAYVIQGNEAAAINAFRKSIMIKPEFTLSYLDLADVYNKRGDGEFAIEQLKTAISIDPNYCDARLKLGEISLETGKYKQAISVYSELVGVDGYNSQALKGLANSYYGQSQAYSNKAILGSHKDLCKALDSINKAIAASNQSGTPDLELHLAKLKLAKLTNQPKLSRDTLNQIVQSSARDLAGNLVKGEAYLTLNDYKNAQIAFDTAIKLSQNQDDDLYLADIFLYNKQYACAEKILHKILESDPHNQEALSALDHIQKCKKYADNYFKSAQIFLKNRNTPTALEYLNRSIEANPNNAKAHLILAQIYEKQKNSVEAAANYRAYLSLEQNAQDSNKIEKKIKSLENNL